MAQNEYPYGLPPKSGWEERARISPWLAGFYDEMMPYSQDGHCSAFHYHWLVDTHGDFSAACDRGNRYGPTDREPTLVDVFMLWLCIGNAIKVCETHANFVMTFTMVVCQWTNDPEDPRRKNGKFSASCWPGGGRELWLNRKVTRVFDGNPTELHMHPIFNPSFWDDEVRKRRDLELKLRTSDRDDPDYFWYHTLE